MASEKGTVVADGGHEFSPSTNQPLDLFSYSVVGVFQIKSLKMSIKCN